MGLPFDPVDLSFTPLSEKCPREAFSCGDDTVDRWFREQSENHHSKYRCRVTTVEAPGGGMPVAFYALSMKSVKQHLLTKDLVGKMFVKFTDQFPSLHAEWVAVRKDLQDNGLGKFLMGVILNDFFEAIDKFGLQAMTLEAIDQKTEDFYYKIGFRRYGPPVLRRQMLIGARAVVEGRNRLEQGA